MAERFEIQDFSGGITDYPLNAPINKMKTCDNLLINKYPNSGKLFTRFGSELYSTTYPAIPGSTPRIGMAFLYKTTLHVQAASKLYYFSSGSGWVAVNGPTGNDAFLSATSANYFTYSSWNFHTLVTHTGQAYPKKIIRNASSVPVIVEAGLPKFDSSAVTITPGAGANTWLYKFVYRRNYTTEGNVAFSDVGTPSDTKTASAAALNVVITTIPVLSNSTTSNFDTANMKIDIYRTTNAGTTFFFVATINNGTTNYTDSTSDASLILNTQLYTTGGVVANDRPPKCKVVHIMGDVAYYGNILTDGGEALNFRMQQSIAGDIDSAPATFFVDVDDEIITISSTKSNCIILCRNSTYRVDGFFDELGRGGMTAERISDTAGCVSPQCAVQALDGVFWLGLDGVYFTDGFKVLRLNGDFDRTYKTYVTNGGLIDDTKTFKIQGKYDKKKNRIWWTIQGEGATDVNLCYILDLNFGIGENAPFTTASGTSFAPSAIEFDNGDLIRCDKRGYVLNHSEEIYVDLKIDTTISPANWEQETIIYNFESAGFNFGSSSVRKYVTSINVSCENSTNLSLQIISNNDDSRVVSNLLPIRYRGNITWGDPNIYWGDASLFWNKRGLIDQKRRMPYNSMRCNYKSIRMTNAKVAILSSDKIGTATIDSSALTVTLTNAATYNWPANASGYVISFASDGYVLEYPIVNRTADTLTYTDSNTTSSSATDSGWVIRGYPRGEVLNLLNYSIMYDVFGPTMTTYKNADSGEVGA